ncbi:MAG: Sec-independent protein translocase protein TatB [Acetobacteraceae bacterium]
MFDFSWSQIVLIAVVALVLIGPKDLPIAIRAITTALKKARRMASEFQTHVDEMVRDANLSEVKNQISEIRNFDIRTEIEKAVDPDGSIRSTFASDPLYPQSSTSAAAVGGTADDDPSATDSSAAAAQTEEPPPPVAEPAKPLAPAFIPPNMVPTPEPAAASREPAEPPPFIPPEVVRQQRPAA